MIRLCIALLGFALFACNPNTSGTATSEPTDSTTTTPQPAVPAPAADVEVTKGENYEIRVIDGTIKSPRKELAGKLGDTEVIVNYGSPAMNERTIYGDLVPYGKVWRTGANEATRITFNSPVMVGAEKKELAAGTYALFTIPNAKEEWMVIFNKVGDQWGAYDYDEAQDAARITGNAKVLGTPAERMDFMLDQNDVVLKWADVAVSFPVASK